MSASIDLIRLTDELRERGVVLYLEGQTVRWRAPQGAMSLALIRRIKALDAELRWYLAAMEAARAMTVTDRARST